MGSLVTPTVHLVGETKLDLDGVYDYLVEADVPEFWDEIQAAQATGVADSEILSSMAAKLCYKALSTKHNRNISRVRGIPDNIVGTLASGHGSVFEHTWFNFVIKDCSRIFTHELVRHRVGTAFSQTSGRYVRSDTQDVVFDPILLPMRDLAEEWISSNEARYAEACKIMKIVNEDGTDNSDMQFSMKKKITSAIRRFSFNGQTNEICFSLNARMLRQITVLRTARFAEWEIRHVFNDIYKMMSDSHPLLFSDAKTEEVDGLLEVSGMKLQPWERSLEDYSVEELEAAMQAKKDS